MNKLFLKITPLVFMFSVAILTLWVFNQSRQDMTEIQSPLKNTFANKNKEEGTSVLSAPLFLNNTISQPISLSEKYPSAVVRPYDVVTFHPVLTNNLSYTAPVLVQYEISPTFSDLTVGRIPETFVVLPYNAITLTIPVTIGGQFSEAVDLLIVGSTFVQTSLFSTTQSLKIISATNGVELPMLLRNYQFETPISTPTFTPTPTPTNTSTLTSTNTPTSTPTSSSTPTHTPTPTITPTSTPFPCANPTDDPSNWGAGFATACEIRVGETRNGTINIPNRQRLDFYSSTLQINVPYTFTLINTSNTGDLDLYLYPDPPDYNFYIKRSTNYATAPEILVFTPTSGQKYYLMIYGYLAPSDVNYSISVETSR